MPLYDYAADMIFAIYNVTLIVQASIKNIRRIYCRLAIIGHGRHIPHSAAPPADAFAMLMLLLCHAIMRDAPLPALFFATPCY